MPSMLVDAGTWTINMLVWRNYVIFASCKKVEIGRFYLFLFGLNFATCSIVLPQKITSSYLGQELSFSFSHSSGPGGQHVNKVNTRVELRLDVVNSRFLSDEQKNRIIEKLSTRLTNDGVLILTSQEGRSQFANKQAATAKLNELLSIAFKIIRKRRPTKPTKASKKRRLAQKKYQADKKKGRKKV